MGGQKAVAHAEAIGSLRARDAYANRLFVLIETARGAAADPGLPNDGGPQHYATEPGLAGHDIHLPGAAILVRGVRAGDGAAGAWVRWVCDHERGYGRGGGTHAADARFRSGRAAGLS